ncbi:hypothetical protein GB927_012770 [Shinella sp. CPCC 100929]|uniref:Uncharacterized protein n=1 Tax=Shinella lacus TaxID=2654216 RepID=A0ABT1R6W2_9HYPH|nr:hypothetical protein [Shinella lacus]MCQ4630918.1 hypothetical protein [Shinella lacus]
MTEIPEAHANIFEVLLVCLMQKADMVAAGEDRRTVECSRCGGQLHLALVGARKHLRMACDGGCGMEAME